MLGNVFNLVLTMALLDTKDYDPKDQEREQMLREQAQKRKQEEMEEYRQRLLQKISKYNTSYI